MKNNMIEKVVSCGIIPVYKNENGEREYLLVQLHHGGISFPKGHIESDETFLQTAERELLEETGLLCNHVDIQNMITETYTINRPEKIIHKTVHYFIGFVNDKKVTPQIDEIKDYFWGNAEQTLKKINHSESKEVFKKARAL